MTALAEKSAEAGAPGEEEIEVTPAMIDAGVDALADFNLDFESDGSAVRRIFLAMMRASLAET